MKSNALKFGLFIIGVVVLVAGIGFLSKAGGPGKYDAFAQHLTDSGAKFYGAFWCPHCQAEKALFGSSKKLLPYIECSKADHSQTQACIDAKIESYPTWFFKDGITLTTTGAPIVCTVAPGIPGEQDICKNVASPTARTWIFPGVNFSVRSAADPVVVGSVWKFPVTASVTGEIPLSFLAAQTGFTLPQ
jgi:glutaredoxin